MSGDTLSDDIRRRLQELDLPLALFLVKKAHMLEQPPPQIVFADGFGALKEVDDYLNQCIKHNKSPFIALSGQSGTGRSVAASYLLKRWQDLRHVVDDDRYIVPDVGQLHHDHCAIFIEWFTTLSRKAPRVGEVNNAVRDALGATIQQPGAAYAFKLNEHAVAYGQILAAANPPGAAAVCFDDIVDAGYLRDCQGIFDGSSMLCVCTMTPELSANANLNGWKVIALNALQGNDVAAFINDYWGNYTHQALPFDLQIVQRAFAHKSYTITKVRTLMRELLISKLVLAQNTAWDDTAFGRALQFAEAGVNLPAAGAGGGE